MKEASLVEEFEKLRTVKRKGTGQGDAGKSGGSGGSGSGTRRTRSQAAPEWTAQDSLILVYEISAVEGECANALSTYQKWSIISENCTALDVPRTSSQCRRKWDSLLTEYNMIVEWQKSKRGVSFWSLDNGRRKKAGLPLDFTEDLFKAIDEVMMVQEERPETDPDTDPEAEFDASDSKETGSKKLRRQENHHSEMYGEKKGYESLEDDLPLRSVLRKAITKERENPSMASELQLQPAHCEGIDEETEHVPIENNLEFSPASSDGFSDDEEMEHVSPNESQNQRDPYSTNTEETEHAVLGNGSRSQSTSCIGSTEKEHASIGNYSHSQSTPSRGNTKTNERISVECESQKPSIPAKGISEEKELAPAGNKSCYQLTPGKDVMEGEEHSLSQIEPCSQSTPSVQASEEKEHVSPRNEYIGEIDGAEERRQLLVAKLEENAQLIHTIISGNSSQKTDIMSAGYDEALEMKRARQTADKLITCIADLAKNLDLLNKVA